MRIRLGNFFFRSRNFLFPAVLMGLVLTTRPRPFFNMQAADVWMDAFGLGMAVAGQLLRAVVISTAYVKRGGKDRNVYADTLVQEGVFAHCRNPLYLGNLLVLFGLVAVYHSAILYAVAMPFFLMAYDCIVRAEEDYLHRTFGQEYVDYCRRVPRFIPSLKGLGHLKLLPFDWKKLIRKEYGSTFAWVTCALFLLVREQFDFLGYEACWSRVRFLILLWIPVVVAYATARVLKKRGHLGSG
ncbi:MAG: S-isoprenylcysteine methyltransferase [Planctomycetes bacterium]|nr:S-isoprenylcysteine methyltransferase [Planctomycetota bacterium]